MLLQTEKRIEASGELYSVLARNRSSEASTVARSVTGLEGMGRRGRYSTRTAAENTGTTIQGATQILAPVDVSQVRLANMQ